MAGTAQYRGSDRGRTLYSARSSSFAGAAVLPCCRCSAPGLATTSASSTWRRRRLLRHGLRPAPLETLGTRRRSSPTRPMAVLEPSGSRLTEYPQFYLVPVGLSAILFAGSQSRAGRNAAVNAIRSVGLMVIYVSLALPIWQFEASALADAPARLARRRLRRDRPAAANLPLARPHDVRARRRLRNGASEPRLRHGQMGHHAGPGDRAGAVRRARPEKNAHPEPDARLLCPRPDVESGPCPRPIEGDRLERIAAACSRGWGSDGAACQETGTRIRSVNRDEWRAARRGGSGVPGIPRRSRSGPHNDGVVHE